MNCVSPSSLSLDLPAEPASVAASRHALAEFIAGQRIDRAAVEVAVSEAVSNAVLHAYRDGDAPGRVRVRAQFDAGALRVEVADRGRGMRPRADSPGLGLGLPLIAQLATHVDITSENGTTVVMDFAVG
jgi:anti-sigma regulatory factor (Ser/Thr protein kinase)